MNIEALPKILFLNEESQQMQDRRIRNKVQYDTSGQAPIKKITKKINNTIQLTQKLSANNQINSLVYSNKLGLLVTCIEDQILITDFIHLESYLATSDASKKSLTKISTSIQFSGKVYLSPDETKILAVNQDYFLLYDLTNQSIISKATNQHQLRHFIFVTQNSFAGWNFLADSYLFENITSSFTNVKSFQGIQMCTSINVIQNHIFICQKVNPGGNDESTKIFVYNQTASQQLNEILLSDYQNNDNYVFNYTQVISIFSIKHQKQGAFKQKDVYGLVLAYYDDQEYQPDRRYLNFMKGNLLQKNSKLINRGFQLFLSPTQDRTFYYNQNNDKLPFQVQILSAGIIKIIMIERLEVIFVVDSNQQFQKMVLYTLQPVHEIKLQGKQYFKGICIMKNMLDIQRKPSSLDSNQTCDMICRDFNGQFLSLYFPAKQTQLTVPFPYSILALGDNKIQRKYAIQTYSSVQEYQVDRIKQAISKIKSHIIKIQNPIKIKIGEQSISQNQPKRQEILINKIETPQVKAPSQQVKQEIKSSIFNQLPQKTNLFGNDTKTNSLFDNKSKPSTNFLFGAKPAQGQASLFGPKLGTQKTSLFGQKTAQTSLFPQIKDGNTLEGGIFATKTQQQKVQTPLTTGIFAPKKQGQKPLPDLFAPKKQGQKPLADLFAPKKQGQKPVPDLFASKKQGQKPLSDLFAPKKQGQKPVPDLFASKKQGQKPLPDLFQNMASSKKVQQKKDSQLVKEIQLKPKQIKKEEIIEIKPKQVIKPVNEQQILRTQAKKQIIKQREIKQQKSKMIQNKSVNIDKLRQLGQLFGHQQMNMIPQPLRLLTQQQIDALIGQMSLILPKKQQIRQTRQRLVRQKLLKQQHLVKIIDEIDNVRNYVKVLKESNEIITSPTMFTISNVNKLLKQLPQCSQQLLRSCTNNTQKKVSQLKSKNQLSNVVRSYVQRMQFLQKQYMSIQQQNEQNRNPNKRVGQQQQLQVKQNRIRNKLVNIEDKIGYLIYYNGNIYPQRYSFIRNELSDQQYEKKWIDITSRKNQSTTLLINKVNMLLNSFNQSKYKQSKQQKQTKSKQYNNKNQYKSDKIRQKQQLQQKQELKSNSILTNRSKQNKKKKGHYKFTLDNTSSSQQQHQFINSNSFNNTNNNNNKNNNNLNKNNLNKNNLYYNNQFYQQQHKSISYNQSKLLFKFKPKTINLNQQFKHIQPIIQLKNISTPLLYNHNQFNPIDLFKNNSSNNLQSSIKKSINFKDKIPIKKQQTQHNITKFKRVDHSEEFLNIHQSSHDEFDNTDSQHSENQNYVPNMGRSISKFNPQDLLSTKKPQQKSTLQTQPKTVVQIKKTFEQDVSDKKGLLNHTKIAASIFNKEPAKTENKEVKAQQKPIGSLFANLTGVGNNLTGIGNVQNKQQKKDSVKLISAQQKKPQSKTTEATTKQNIKINKDLTKKQQKPSDKLFGLGTTPTGSLFNTSFNFGTKPNQQLKNNVNDAKKQEQKGEQTKKQVVKNDKNQISSLFGTNTVKVPAFGQMGTNGSLFSKPAQINLKKTQSKSSQPAKNAQNITQITQKQSSQLKKQQNIAKVQDKKQQKKPTTSLFGDNKSSLFGSNSSSLFGPATTNFLSTKQQPNKNQNTSKTNQNQDLKKTAVFGNNNVDIFGKEKESSKPLQQVNKLGIGIAPFSSSKQQENKTSSEIQSKIQSPKNISVKPAQSQQQKLLNENKSLFGNNTSTGLFSNQQSNQNTFISGSLINQQKQPHQSFGAQNRFLVSQTPQQKQPQQNMVFNPMSGSFGNNTGFGQISKTGGFRSFATVGGNPDGNMFNQTANQPQNNLFTQQNSSNNVPNYNPLFGNQQQGSTLFNQPQQNTGMFGNSQQQNTGMFGNQQQNTGGMFGGMNQQAPSGNNFMTGFNPTANLQTNPPNAVNPSMMKARK